MRLRSRITTGNRQQVDVSAVTRSSTRARTAIAHPLQRVGCSVLYIINTHTTLGVKNREKKKTDWQKQQ